MVSDESVEELHEMAARIGMKREWFQGHDPRSPHYDVTPPKRKLAVENGAIETDGRGVIEALRRFRRRAGLT